MSEWFDGYWTAIRQVSIFKNIFANGVSPSWADWVSALGTVLAALIAAGAAWLSWSASAQSLIAAREAELLSLERERNDIVRSATSLAHTAKLKASEYNFKSVINPWEKLDARALLRANVSESTYLDAMKKLDGLSADAETVQKKALQASGFANLAQIRSKLTEIERDIAATENAVKAEEERVASLNNVGWPWLSTCKR